MTPTKRKRPRGPTTKLQVLVAAVTAAERGMPMPQVADLARDIGCVEHGVSMALADLEARGILRRVSTPGKRLRVMVVETGAATAEV